MQQASRGCIDRLPSHRLRSSANREQSFTRALHAVAQASSDAGVLILAQQCPLATTQIEPSVFDETPRKNLCLSIEFPERITGMEIGSIHSKGR